MNQKNNKKKHIVYIVIPTYNEKKNINTIIQKLLNTKINNCQIFVTIIDSNSSDNTQKIVKSFSNKNVLLITQKYKKGIGNAYKKTFKLLQKKDVYAIITMDADGQHDLQFINKAINLLNQGYNYINASRFLPESEIKDNKYKRKNITVALNSLLRLKSSKIKKMDITDISSGLQCIQYDVFKQLDVDALPDGYEFQIDLKKQIANLKNIRSTQSPLFSIRWKGCFGLL
jgi:dolichol-phosphate mannosyltransferase